MLILPSIAFNLNNSGRKILFKFSSFVLLGQSHVRVFMVVFFSLPLMLLTTTAKIRRQYLRVLSFIRVYSCGIVGFTEQRTTFTRAQSAILQSRIFRVELNCSNIEISIFL